jgi:hypothetical protein
MHSKPDANTSTRVKVLKKGSKYKYYGTTGDYYSVGGGYVNKKYAKVVSSPSSSSKPKSTAHGWETTSALNLRSSASYNGKVLTTMPKGAHVEYLGMVDGWAKVKYNGKTGYAGKSYLKQFKTGGYTGDWAGDEGKLAVLHKKEIVLNEKQTSNILDSAKIMDKISKYLPEVSKANVLDKLATASSVVTNVTYGDISVIVQGGYKKKATDIAKELMNEIKKKGK